MGSSAVFLFIFYLKFVLSDNIERVLRAGLTFCHKYNATLLFIHMLPCFPP
jgi:hypothetical protein